MIIFILFCHLFLAFKLEFPFRGSKPVCIRMLDDNTNVKVLEACRHCYTKEKNKGLVISTTFAVILRCLLVTPVLLAW